MRCLKIGAALLAAAVGLGGCTTMGINVDTTNTVSEFDRKTKVIDGITYTRIEYVDGSVEYTAHNSPPKGYTGWWPNHPDYRGTVIYVGPKGTRRTLESKGTPPLDPLDPKLWDTPQTITAPAVQPVSAPLAGPTASRLPPRGEGAGGGAGGGGGGGGGSGSSGH